MTAVLVPVTTIRATISAGTALLMPTPENVRELSPNIDIFWTPIVGDQKKTSLIPFASLPANPISPRSLIETLELMELSRGSSEVTSVVMDSLVPSASARCDNRIIEKLISAHDDILMSVFMTESPVRY